MNIYAESLVNSDITASGFIAEIEVKNHTGDIFLSDLTGPIIAENVNGDTQIAFSELSQQSPTSVVAVNGRINIKMPKDANMDITTKTRGGLIYTDFEIDIRVEKTENIHFINGTINNGGVEVFLQSTQGNISLEKN